MGVVFYQSFLSSWRLRRVLIFVTVIGSCASVVDIVIIMRWNVRWGIPDKVFFLLGNAVFETLLGALWGVVSSVIVAKIAPPGMESAVFSYTVGISNFCSMVSGLLGSGAIQWSGMKTTIAAGDNGCDFEALPYLILVCQIVSPLCIGVPASFLVPNALQTEHLIDWEKEEGWQSRAKERGGESRSEAVSQEVI